MFNMIPAFISFFIIFQTYLSCLVTSFKKDNNIIKVDSNKVINIFLKAHELYISQIQLIIISVL